ncbi:retinal guanylyl cyclase 2 [Aricia agestis]|uniref:retinal guanylyl cyclase 2 n=1 Tax=Aricia agestis TaxID=91739 RepID=UPI001C20A91E|nr:retinal guanylyl cyclase 2 [Aricia agestis]
MCRRTAGPRLTHVLINRSNYCLVAVVVCDRRGAAAARALPAQVMLLHLRPEIEPPTDDASDTRRANRTSSSQNTTDDNTTTTEASKTEKHDFRSPKKQLILSDDFDDEAGATESLYEDIVDSIRQYDEDERTRTQYYNSTFYLLEASIEDDTPAWNRVAILKTSSMLALDSSKDWITNVAIDYLIGVQRWSALRGSELIDIELHRNEGHDLPAVGILCVVCTLFGVAIAAGAQLARRLVARRKPRRPRAAPILALSEFQFPADDRRRVGEGMETMLSWLQQLHDFGGPETERPDLLKRPEALAPSAPSSTCSVTRLAPDNRPRYKGDPIHMKYLPTAALELRRKATDVLLVMQSIRHENLNPFIGCLPEVRPALVWSAGARGSLEDVLVADDIRLDWTFRLSLLTDLVRGMRHLHASPLRLHARLTSRNCVVDSRWVLRVTDYGLPAFARTQGLPYPPRSARELLWTAPELLREASGQAVPSGTQAGDVFSFAIIMQEVIVRGEPYCMLSLSPEEIIEKLTRPPPLIRPSVSMGAAPPEAVSVMRQCWAEQPEMRPDFNRLYDIFRHLHRGRKVNIVDSMFEMLEKYSNNLEELIRERTDQLDMEKKKTEQLLNRMLPRSVAERLMLGLRVEPEEFEEVSIYFSDIVGFTAIAARSSPVQVVDLLNDLYTAFDATIEQYRVYKVETIGDAYMVVGGLPLRCADHAERVATMALHLLHVAGRLRVRHLPGAPLRLRVGLHTGPCCAGVVGLTMPRYCLFGDTVNTASRMESTGAAWRIQVSAATAERLAAAGGFRLRPRGLTQIKGKGAMYTYWLLGKDGFDKTLPTPPPLE